MTILSFEFFPPNTPAGLEKLRATREALDALEPAFYSVTFGAGGSTREKTLGVVAQIAEAGRAVAPHLSCIGATKASIGELLDDYRARGIRRLVALRGDLPSGMVDHGEFRYANELIGYIRAHSGDWFHIEVAAYPEMHPQAPSPAHDLDNFLRKVDAGADSAITQYFFNAAAYFDFVARVRARGIDIPIVPGIMPITNFTQLARFSDTCGAEIPRWIRLRLAGFGDDTASIKAFGHEVVTALVDELVAAGVPGIHFYTLNQAGPSAEIWRAVRQSGR
ncbi:MAG: methylenetetrahydrofolate reductase [NAD(P)H] [Lautropia sp.]